MIGKLTQIASIYGRVCVCALQLSFDLFGYGSLRKSVATYIQSRPMQMLHRHFNDIFYQPMCTELQQLEINFIYICCAKFDLRQANCL